MEGSQIAKWLIFIGIGLVILGLIIWVIYKMGLPLGKLPGDLHIEKEKFRIYVPIVTSLVISIVLTLLINFIFWLSRK